MSRAPKAAKRCIQATDPHTCWQWAEMIAYVAEALYGNVHHITLVQDKLTAYRKAALYQVYAPKRARAIVERIPFVAPLKHGFWLNVAELELRVLSRGALKERIESKESLMEQIKAPMNS